MCGSIAPSGIESDLDPFTAYVFHRDQSHLRVLKVVKGVAAMLLTAMDQSHLRVLKEELAENLFLPDWGSIAPSGIERVDTDRLERDDAEDQSHLRVLKGAQRRVGHLVRAKDQSHLRVLKEYPRHNHVLGVRGSIAPSGIERRIAEAKDGLLVRDQSHLRVLKENVTLFYTPTAIRINRTFGY